MPCSTAFDLNRRNNNLQDPQPGITTEASEIQARIDRSAASRRKPTALLCHDATSHLDASLDRIADQSQDYYSSASRRAMRRSPTRGQYRRVTVRVTRPGAKVSARTGYAAPTSAPLDRRRAIDAALSAPFVQQALRVDYTTYTLRSETTGRARVVLSLEADLPVKSDRNQTADVVFVVRDSQDGRVAASGTDTMPLPAEPTKAASSGVGTYHVHFELPPGSYIMRTVVREPGGLIGSADRRIDVRAFSGPDVTVSDLDRGPRPARCPCAPRVRGRRTLGDGRNLRTCAGSVARAQPSRHPSCRPAATTRPRRPRRSSLIAACRRRRQPACIVRAAAEGYCARALSRARAGDRGKRADCGPHARSRRAGRRRAARRCVGRDRRFARKMFSMAITSAARTRRCAARIRRPRPAP